MPRENDYEGCLFCRIVAGTEPSFTVWEDDRHVAFLTPFPNSRGFTVLATRAHRPSYVLSLDEPEYVALFLAARTLGACIDRALGTRRTGLVAEGMGIDHAHVKLIPMHGIPDGPWQPILSAEPQSYETYPGYLSTHDGPLVDDEQLREVAALIRKSE